MLLPYVNYIRPVGEWLTAVDISHQNFSEYFIMNKKLPTKLLILLTPLFLLVGCAKAPVGSTQGASSSAVSTVPNASAACAVKVVQDGKPAKSDVMAGATRYLLKGGRFRIEVANVLCDPSIGVLTKPTDFFYVAGSSVIATTSMFAMAGDTASGAVLIGRSEDPRLISPFEDMFDSSEDKYKAACAQLGKCPLKIRAFRSYWPFASDDKGTRRTFAEFRYLFEKRPLDGFKGDVPVVVYTKLTPKESTPTESAEFFNVFAIQPFILHFE